MRDNRKGRKIGREFREGERDENGGKGEMRVKKNEEKRKGWRGKTGGRESCYAKCTANRTKGCGGPYV